MKATKALLLPLAFLTVDAFAHTVPYPHGHPHVSAPAWVDVLITAGLLGAVTLASLGLFHLLARRRAARLRNR